jgi:hypothetical protein
LVSEGADASKGAPSTSEPAAVGQGAKGGVRR